MTIGIATFPIQKASIIPFSNIINILHSISDDIYVITGYEGVTLYDSIDGVHVHLIKYKPRESAFGRIGNYIWTQFKISYELAKLSRNIDMWIFFGGGGLLLPALTSKLFGREFTQLLISSPAKMIDNTIGTEKGAISKLSNILRFTTNICLSLSKNIVVYSQNIINEEAMLAKHKNKILIAHEHFLNIEEYKIKKCFNERDCLVGYVGRFSEEKGTLNFVRAILGMSKEADNAKFLIGGDGRLRGEIKKYLTEMNLNDKVKLLGWIPHDELPDHFNRLRLLVLPSYTEGLPNIMLEAMACGTPVLATPVGAIPDIIKDGETGFLMENNSPECISTNVIRALEHPDLEGIAKRARALMEREYTFDKTVELWRNVLGEMGYDGR